MQILTDDALYVLDRNKEYISETEHHFIMILIEKREPITINKYEVLYKIYSKMYNAKKLDNK